MLLLKIIGGGSRSNAMLEMTTGCSLFGDLVTAATVGEFTLWKEANTIAQDKPLKHLSAQSLSPKN